MIIRDIRDLLAHYTFILFQERGIHMALVGLLDGYPYEIFTGLQDDDEGIMLLKQSNLQNPIRNLAIFISGNPTWGIYSPSWTVGRQKFWNTMRIP